MYIFPLKINIFYRGKGYSPLPIENLEYLTLLWMYLDILFGVILLGTNHMKRIGERVDHGERVFGFCEKRKNSDSTIYSDIRLMGKPNE